MKKLLNCMLYTYDVRCNLSRWNSAGVMISKKRSIKTKHFEKIVFSFKAKKNNALVSGNACGKKIFTRAAAK